MKRKIVALVFACLLVCLCTACGGDKEHAGEWALRGAEYEGLLVQPEVLGITSSLTLEEDGSGRLRLDEFGFAIKSWSFKDGKITVKTLDDILEGRFRDGYVVLAFDDGVSLYYAKEGSDVAFLPLLDEAGYEAAYAALVESGDAMPID